MRRWMAAGMGVCFLLLYFLLPAVLPAPLPARPTADPAATTVPGAEPSPGVAAPKQPGQAQAPAQVQPSAPYRAVWISYLEWQTVDFSTPAAFLADVEPMLEAIAGLGATVVLAHVRPFGDALYPSAYYPFSHLCTGVQGRDPGYDPLQLLVAAAHARGLQIEAWVNPYRLQANGMPAPMAAQSPANLHAEWVKTAAGEAYLDPANPEARQYIADALAELCENYAIDGIHFDDYFYPTTDPAFDAQDYAAYLADGGTLPLEEWRQQQVDALVRLCWQTVHQYPGLRFGIAPQGNPQTNLATQYSNAARWLAEPGFVDYLMPQLYWGLQYRQGGSTYLSLPELAAAWAAMPRAEGVELYAGLGAYRIGDGDGSAGGEWQSGAALAQQVQTLAALGVDGVALYRYGSLFGNDAWPDLARQERQALTELWINSFNK